MVEGAIKFLVRKKIKRGRRTAAEKQLYTWDAQL